MWFGWREVHWALRAMNPESGTTPSSCVSKTTEKTLGVHDEVATGIGPSAADPLAPPRGEVVARYATYDQAQRAIDLLSDSSFPVEYSSIVGRDLSLVEQVTGRMTKARATLMGAASGAWFGLFIGLFVGLFIIGPIWISLVIAGLVIGAVWGGAFGFAAQWATRGQRDFASASAIVAAQYELTVADPYTDRARQLLSQLGGSRDDVTTVRFNHSRHTCGARRRMWTSNGRGPRGADSGSERFGGDPRILIRAVVTSPKCDRSVLALTVGRPGRLYLDDRSSPEEVVRSYYDASAQAVPPRIFVLGAERVARHLRRIREGVR